ncbi:uncharacterized protein LOC134259060 isoform X1 [Saccostrea cucullata]|uniref:uncharacterized protein LOC134259060 isoform X1 n=1 Tax=Saccostrea cuccullata TaxID=36930 RepID=UPI002ED018D7
MDTDSNTNRWLTILKFLLLTFFSPVQCARGNYCYSYYSVNGYKFYYCIYYSYYKNSYSSSASTGVITGAVIGGIVGLVILVCIVVIIYVKVCKKKNDGNVIVRPIQPNINSTQNTFDGNVVYQPAPNPVCPPPYEGSLGSAPPGTQTVRSYFDPVPYNG